MNDLLNSSWIIPMTPLLAASFLGVLLLCFNKTMNRLSKPVGVILFSSLGISAVFSFFLALKSNQIQTQYNDLFTYDIAFSSAKLHGGLLIDEISMKTSFLVSACLFLLFYISHNYMYRKNKYVKHFILLGFFTSFLLSFLFSSSLEQSFLLYFLIILFTFFIRDIWSFSGSREESENRLIKNSIEIEIISPLIGIPLLYFYLPVHTYVGILSSDGFKYLNETGNITLAFFTVVLLFLPFFLIPKSAFSILTNSQKINNLSLSTLISFTVLISYGAFLFTLKPVISELLKTLSGLSISNL